MLVVVPARPQHVDRGGVDRLHVEPSAPPAVERMMDRHSPDRRWWWDGFSWRPAWSPDRRYWFDGMRWNRVDGTVTGWVVGGLVAWIAAALYAQLTAEAIGEAPQPAQDQWVWDVRLSAMLPLVFAVVAGAVGLACGARRRRLARVVFIALTCSSLFVLFMVVPKPA